MIELAGPRRRADRHRIQAPAAHLARDGAARLRPLPGTPPGVVREEPRSSRRRLERSTPSCCRTRTSITRARCPCSGAGYRGPIYATTATRDLCAPMLHDAAMHPGGGRRHIRAAHRAGRATSSPSSRSTAPTTSSRARQMVGLPYHRPHVIAPGMTLRRSSTPGTCSAARSSCSTSRTRGDPRGSRSPATSAAAGR